MSRKRLPGWAWVLAGVAAVLMCCSGAALIGSVPEAEPEPAPTRPGMVTTSGLCEKKLIGEYGLVATVTVTNGTDQRQTGTAWVRWPVTGEKTQEFVKRMTIEPGASVEFPIQQAITADRWNRTGACSYGWTAGDLIKKQRIGKPSKKPVVRETADRTPDQDNRSDSRKGGSGKWWR